jgi:hypothetical protein
LNGRSARRCDFFLRAGLRSPRPKRRSPIRLPLGPHLPIRPSSRAPGHRSPGRRTFFSRFGMVQAEARRLAARSGSLARRFRADFSRFNSILVPERSRGMVGGSKSACDTQPGAGHTQRLHPDSPLPRPRTPCTHSIPARKDRWGPRDRRGSLGPRVRRARRVPRAHRVTPDHKGLKAMLGRPARRARRGRRVTPARWAPKARKGYSAHRGQLDPADHEGFRGMPGCTGSAHGSR